MHLTRLPASVWQAPLVPVALSVTAGIVADRYFALPVLFSLLTAVGSLIAWLVLRRSSKVGLPLLYLWIAVAGLAAAYHHGYREGFSADDIGRFATAEPRPVRLRGAIVAEPTVVWQVHNDPLQSIDRADPTVAVLEVTQLNQGEDWSPVSGRVQLIVTGALPGLHVGDEVEVVGRLTAPRGPANPGELDNASFLKDQRIRGVVAVRKTPAGVTVLAEKWPRSLGGWLGFVRSWAQQALKDHLPKATYDVATALLLGEGSTMTHADWEKYIRTGVIHVLAISGQHLIILAGFLWAALRLLRVRRRRGALGVALFLFAYCLLTGGRPPALRAAVAVGIYCGGMLLRRPPLTANSFALGWLVVAALNPTDLFGAGCQLSFLAVALLYWGTNHWIRFEQDPLDRLIEDDQSLWYRTLRRLARTVAWSYLVTVIVWLAVAPLVASHYHLVSPIGILIGPPVILLGAVALLAGFCLLLAAAVCGPLVPICAWVTHWSLAGCEVVVNHADGWSLSHWYMSDLPEWWLWLFYVGLLGFLMLETLRRRVHWVALAGLGWLCVGLVSGWSRPSPDELRCTFLAVGHGGCTVMEAPDGRVLLYDAGALGGPDVTRKQIAPFLWSRNIRRIDEVFLSHADLDHFNGLPSLLDRFAVGQVSCTPTFADKTAPGVAITLAAIQRRGIPIRILKAGDRLSAGSVTMEVLHPAADGPPGKENFRSLVLVVRHGGHAVMLTGDLEGPGLERVLVLRLPLVDVLMAPHHGSRAGDAREKDNRAKLAALTRPRLIVSCQGPPRSSPNKPDPYAASGARFLGTWPHGAITIRSHPDRLTVETFQTGQSFSVSNR
jgi:competence protein ComEC